MHGKKTPKKGTSSQEKTYDRPGTKTRPAGDDEWLIGDFCKRVFFGIYLYIYCDNYNFSFGPGRSRAVQKLKKWVCTARDRPATKTEIKIVTINVKANSEEVTFAEIYCTVGLGSSLLVLVVILTGSRGPTLLICLYNSFA